MALFGTGSPLSNAVFDALAGRARLAAVVVPGIPASLAPGAVRARLARRGLVRRARRARVPLLYSCARTTPALEAELRRLAPDLICVASFPRLLPPGLLCVGRLGAVGLHPSLLPRHRGPAPLFWTYFADDRETGVTLHRLDAGEDTGEILAQETLPLPRGQSVEELYATLARRGAALLLDALADIEAGRAQGRPQAEQQATREGLPRPGTWRIGFDSWGAERVWHFLSGLGRRHGALLRDAAGRAVAHGRARGFVLARHALQPGSLERRRGGWRVACRDGFVDVAGPRAAARLKAFVNGCLRGGWLGRLALLGPSAFLTLVLFEIALSERLDLSPSCLTVLRDLRARGLDAEAPVQPYAFIHAKRLDPALPDALQLGATPTLALGGKSRSAMPFCRESGEWVVYHSDEHGFPNPVGSWGQGPVPIVALGDSFAFGECVPPGQGVVDRLRVEYPGTVSLAYPGNGPLAMLAGLREYLTALRPQVVLWFHFSGNDLEDLRAERRHRILGRYLEPSFEQGLLEKQPALDAALARYAREYVIPVLELEPGPMRRLVWNTLLLRHVRARLLQAQAELRGVTREAASVEASAEDLESFRGVLELARTRAVAGGARLLWVYLPSWEELHGSARIRALADRSRVQLLELVARSGVGVIDVREAFGSQASETLFACRTCHYTADAYRLAAQAVLAALRAGVPEPPARRLPWADVDKAGLIR